MTQFRYDNQCLGGPMCDNHMLMKTCQPIPEGTEPISGHELDHLLSHTAGWEIDDKPVPVELILGYAALGTRENSPEDLLEVAEHLLEMQKV